MGGQDERTPRQATAADAAEVAQLLHDFNSEFGSPSPGAEVLAARLQVLLAGEETIAILAGAPAVAAAVVTLRPNVWYAGQVALLDELYVVPELRGQGIGSTVIDLLMSISRASGVDLIEINVDEGDVDAQRFYERHGFSSTEPGSTERALYYARAESTTHQAEVAVVQRGDRGHGEPLGGGDHRGISGAERQISILRNERGDAQPVGRCDLFGDQVAGGEVAEEPDLGISAESGRNEVRDLRDDEHWDDQRTGMGLQQVEAGPMVPVVGVDVGVQRAGVDDQCDLTTSLARISSIRSEMSW